MEILKIIKSTVPQPIEVEAMLNLLYSSNWVLSNLNKFLKPFGITQQQYNALRILRGQYPKPANVKLVRERLLVKLSDTSRLVDRLVKNEWVTRKINKSDGRAVDIIITEKGLALLKTIDEAEPLMLKIMQNLSEAELHQLSKLLETLRG